MRPRDLLDWLSPARCLACARAGDDVLCAACEQAAPWHDARDTVPPPATRLDACQTLLWLEGPAVEWIHRFKYPAPGLAGLDGPARRLIAVLATRLAERVPAAPGDLVVPIPLFPRRLRARGFNPAGFVARHVAARTGARFAPRVLARVRDTRSQTGLDRTARRANVRSAFACRPVAPWPPRQVWLVDDVVTTGATLAEAATVLRAAGVERVTGLGLARTPGSATAPSGQGAGGSPYI